QGVASRRHGARHVADRQDRSDRQQAGSAGPLHQFSIPRVSRQLLSHEESIMRPILLFVVAVALIAPAVLRASDPGTGNWQMWGGTPDRNQVSNMKNLPTEWDVKSKKNVKCMADLGAQSYGNPVVADGKVFVGTNNELARDPKQ